MACITKTLVFASLNPTNNNNNCNTPSPQSNAYSKPPIPITETITNAKPKTTTLPRKKRVQNKLQQQLTVIQIERAIGAGSYRDTESRDSEQRNSSIFRGLFPNTNDLREGAMERKLRETGEWIGNKIEGEFRSSGKRILMFSFQWVLPIYIFLFLVVSGTIKLPFSTSLLDDLIM